MNLTIVLIIFGTVISILLFILIKKIGNEPQVLPTFPDDNSLPVVVPTIPAPQLAPTIARPTNSPSQNEPNGPAGQSGSNTPTQTTSSLPSNTLVMEVFGASFDSSQISTDGNNPSRLLGDSLLWTNPPNTEIKTNGIDTKLFTIDPNTGILSGPQNPLNAHYEITIFLEVEPLDASTPSPTSSNTFTITIGIGIPSSTGIQKLPPPDIVEASYNNNSITYSGMSASNISTRGQDITQTIPYIYRSDPNKILNGQSNQYAKITITIKKVND